MMVLVNELNIKAVFEKHGWHVTTNNIRHVAVLDMNKNEICLDTSFFGEILKSIESSSIIIGSVEELSARLQMLGNADNRIFAFDRIESLPMGYKLWGYWSVEI